MPSKAAANEHGSQGHPSWLERWDLLFEPVRQRSGERDFFPLMQR